MNGTEMLDVKNTKNKEKVKVKNEVKIHSPHYE